MDAAFRKYYEEYLHSEKWSAKRDEVFKHYGRKCALCGSTDRLQVHHRSYENLGNEKLKQLIPLCEPCHTLSHKLGTAATGIARLLKAKKRSSPEYKEKQEKRAKRREQKRKRGLKKWQEEQAQKAEANKFIPKTIIRKGYVPEIVKVKG